MSEKKESNNDKKLENSSNTDSIHRTEFLLNPYLSKEKILKQYKEYLKLRSDTNFGYPYNLNFFTKKETKDIAAFLKFSINNLGDPFKASNYGVHSRPFEIQVLQFFAKLWKISPTEFWGYVTCSGSEGNLYGILLGREALPDGILYSSKESHNSIFKAAKFYRMESVSIDTHYSGEMNYEDFEKNLQKNLDKPAIININYGTPLKGGIDDVTKVLEILKRNNFTEDRFYIHCDDALFSLMLPNTEKAPQLSFKQPIGSISVSGHKFIGCPMPCGIVITRIRYVKNIERRISYLNSVDTTINGSRNGQAPLFLWYAIKSRGADGFKKEAGICLENARYLFKKLKSEEFGSMINKFSNTVVIERPWDEDFILKWQLACHGTIVAVVVMPNVTREKIDMFVQEMVESRKKYGSKGKICIKVYVGENDCLCKTCYSKGPAQISSKL